MKILDPVQRLFSAKMNSIGVKTGAAMAALAVLLMVISTVGLQGI